MRKEFLCLDCGRFFVISLKERKRLKAEGKHIPTHCPTCRERRWKEKRQRIRRAKKFERKNTYERF